MIPFSLHFSSKMISILQKSARASGSDSISCRGHWSKHNVRAHDQTSQTSFPWKIVTKTQPNLQCAIHLSFSIYFSVFWIFACRVFKVIFACRLWNHLRDETGHWKWIFKQSYVGCSNKYSYAFTFHKA